MKPYIFTPMRLAAAYIFNTAFPPLSALKKSAKTAEFINSLPQEQIEKLATMIAQTVEERLI